MRIKNLSIFLLVLCSLCWGGNGVTMDGGSGHIQSILYTWSNLPELIGPCLADPQCHLSPDGRDLLKAISQTHKLELTQGGLDFVENANSKTVSATDPRIGATIVINLSPLFEKESLSIPESLDLLLTALATHHSEFSNFDFSKTRAQLLKFWSARIEVRDLVQIGHGGISVMTIEQRTFRILGGDGQGYQNILPVITSQLDCFNQGETAHASISNFYWLKPTEAATRFVNLPLYGDIQYSCILNGHTTEVLVGNFQMEFEAEVLEGTAREFLVNPEDYDLKVDLAHPRLHLFDLHEARTP